MCLWAFVPSVLNQKQDEKKADIAAGLNLLHCSDSLVHVDKLHFMRRKWHILRTEAERI